MVSGSKQMVAISKLELERISLSSKAMGVGLWDYNVDADELFCSERWYDIIGIDKKSPRVTAIEHFRKYIHPEDIEIALTVDRAAILMLIKNNEYYRIEFRIIRPTGEIRWLRSVACLIRNDGDGQIRAVGCVTDITEFRAADANSNQAPNADILRCYPARPPGMLTNGDSATGALTIKERECLNWASLGKTAWETAVILGRSRRTVEFHLRNATRKTGGSNTVHAATIAVRQGLL